MDYRHKQTTRGHGWTPIRGQSSTPIDTQARYARLEEIVQSREFAKYARTFASRRGERGRSFQAIKRMIGDTAWLELPPDRNGGALAIFTVLKPRGTLMLVKEGAPPIEAGKLQDCVSINYLAVGSLPHTPVWSSLWTAEVQEHALGRLFQRYPAVDLDAALLELHRNLLCASFSAVRARARANEPLLVPAAGGVFLCEMQDGNAVSVDGLLAAHMRTKTWLPLDQLRDDQEKAVIPPASAPGDEQLGASLLITSLASRNGGAVLDIAPLASRAARGPAMPQRPCAHHPPDRESR